MRRSQLIDTEKAPYPVTRQWAGAIHARHPEAQGLCWTSRQGDRAKALVLFKHRLEAGCLGAASPSYAVTGDAGCYANLLALAGHIGVNIVPGKG